MLFRILFFVAFVVPVFLNGQTDSVEVKYVIADTVIGKGLLKEAEALNHEGKLEEALVKAEEAKTIYIAVLGERTRDVANCWNLLGKIYKSQNKFEQTVQHFQKALEIYVSIKESERDSLWWTQYLTCTNEIGDGFRLIKEYDKALELMYMSVEKGKSYFKQGHPILGKAYINIGNVYRNQFKYDQALSNFQTASDIFIKTFGENHQEVADSYNYIGVINHFQSKNNIALTYFEKALDINIKILGPEDNAVAIAYNNIGLIHSIQGNYNSAISYFQKALNIWKKIRGKEHQNLAAIYSNIGVAYRKLGQFDTALINLNKSLDISLKAHGEIHHDVASCYNSLGIHYHILGNEKQALSYCKKALNIRKKVYAKDHPELAKSYTSIGNIYESIGEYELALSHHFKALHIRKKRLGKSHASLGGNYNSIGNIYENLDKHNLSLTYYEYALNIFQNTGNILAESAVYHNIGMIHYKQSRYELAKNYTQKALDIREKTLGKQHIDVASSFNSLGSIHEAEGQYESAIHNFRKALIIQETLFGTEHPHIANSYYNLSVVYYSQGRYELSLTNIQKALHALVIGFKTLDIYENPILDNNIISKTELLKTLKRKAKSFYQSYSDISQDQKDLQAARNICNINIELVEDIRNSYKRVTSKETLIKNALPIYELSIRTNKELSELTGERSYLEEAFSAFEKSKSVILLESIQDVKAKSFYGLPDSLLSKEYHLNTSVTFYERLLYEEKISTKNTNSINTELWQNKIFHLKSIRDSLLLVFKTKYPSYFKLKHDLAISSISKVQQELLEANQTLLEYFVGDSSIFVFVINKNNFKIHEIKKDFPLEEWVKTFRKANNEEHFEYMTNEFQQIAYNIYQKIIDPVAADLKEKIIIVPDGVLGYLPFEALLTEPVTNDQWNNYPFWLKNKQISYCYSATLLREMKEKKHKQIPENVLLAFAPFYDGDTTMLASLFRFADPEEKKPLHSLPQSGEEVYGVQQIVGGDIFLYQEATEDRFIQNAGNYRVLHLASHGKANDKVGDYSFLAFTEQKDSIENELLYVRDLYNLQLNADMVVLSACETGIGELQRGEGIISLARGFTYAGAKSIITSLWSVEDESTKTLMLSFYSYLKNGLSKDKALQQAKLDYISGQVDHTLAHPFYWSGFIGIGDMEKLTF